MSKISELTIFFPFWNEEENIEKVVRNAVPIAEKYATKWEILIVDDGSLDNTLQIARKLVKENKKIRLISHTPNRGYGAALKAGFENAKYDYVVFTDGDGQFDFSELPKLLEKISNSDLVIGYRKQRHDHPFRHILMNLLKVWDFVFFGFYFKDIDCGFKLFRREGLKKILPLTSEGAMVTTEILARSIKENLKIKEVEVSHYPRKYGNQSGGNIRVIFRAIKESLVLWKKLYYGA